ncbi:MAG: ATP-binding protein [Bdellovibrionaceae bacterium]|nr:ATP-binding protein [Pseudobdellovibrionaceae bacterium]
MTSETKSAARKEKTIRSETTKVFLVIFVILLTVGAFTVYSTFKGAGTFNQVKSVYLKQFQATEVMKQRALEIIAIYYVLGSDQNQDFLMEQLQKYDGLIASFDEGLANMKAAINKSSPDAARLEELAAKTKIVFDDMNTACRQMTFALMAGDKKEGSKHFDVVSQKIAIFKSQLDEIETIVVKALDTEVSKAQGLLELTTWLGVAITVIAIFITLALIYYLMKFLSVTLLPISNMMNNMRQAVFAVDRNCKVISPVSKFSSEVFEEDIVDKNLFDVAYRDVSREGEMFAQAKTAFSSVFGEDDLQWMLMEDCLPPQVKRVAKSTSGDGEEKILKLSYTPLWDKEQKLESVMIVAEDVTEVEKLREESLKKQGEIGIVQGLIGMDRNDVEPFLVEAQRQIQESRILIAKMTESKEAQQALFRTLHTLKGNSRMYALNGISEAVHIAENVVVTINQRLSAGDPVNPELISNLLAELDKVESVLAVHFRMAQKLFNITDPYTSAKMEQCEQSMTALETGLLLLPHGKAAGNGASGVPPEYVAAYEKAMQVAHDNALYFEHLDLAKSVKNFKSAYSENGDMKAALLQMAEAYCQFTLASGLVKAYPKDPDKWISIFQTILTLSEKLQLVAQSPGQKASMDEFEKALKTLASFADNDRFLFLRTIVTKISITLQSGSAINTKAIHELVNYLWRYMASVCVIDSMHALEHGQEKELRSTLVATHHADDATGVLESGLTNRILMLSFLRSLVRRSVPLTHFWTVASRHLDGGGDDGVVEFFFNRSLDVEPVSKLMYKLAEKSNEPKNLGEEIGALENSGHLALAKLLVSEHSGGLLRLDVVQLLLPYFKAEDFEHQGSGPQMVEIPAQNFHEIREQVMRISHLGPEALADAVPPLRRAVEHALDYSVKTVCRKVGPMVKDLAKRLEKQVEFRITGEDIYVRREITYGLRDALVHIIRNSLDHGVEKPEDRIRNGKPPVAVIEIGCRHRQDGYDLVIRDDGKGINVDRIIEKAVASGLTTAEAAAKMSVAEKIDFIFVPNLSTKDEVTAISGRGVGMDAVRETIQKMGGQVRATTEVGQWTEMRLSFFYAAEGSQNAKAEAVSMVS